MNQQQKKVNLSKDIVFVDNNQQVVMTDQAIVIFEYDQKGNYKIKII